MTTIHVTGTSRRIGQAIAEAWRSRGARVIGHASLVNDADTIAAFCALDAPPSMTGAVLDANGASYVR